MAHYTQETTTQAKKYVTASSRYAHSKVRYYTENRLLTFETYKRKPVGYSDSDKWIQITPAIEYRPDLLSYEVYGTPDFWWRILEQNGMNDILDFKSGRVIRITGSVL